MKNQQSLSVLPARIAERRELVYLASALQAEFQEDVSSVSISREAKLFTFEFTPEHTLDVEWADQQVPHLLMLYPAEGSLELTWPKNESMLIHPYQIVASFAQSDFPVTFRFKKGTHYRFYLIKVNRPETPNGSNCLYSQIVHFLESTASRKGNLAVCGPNLTLNDIFSNIESFKGNSLSDDLLTDGYGKLLLGQMILHFRNSEKISEETFGSLTQYEIQQIRRLTEMIKEDPGKNYKVDDLCRKGGLSVTKLQEGFREMHGTTVAKYIQDVRLEKSEELIRTSDMNISEIVYTIGLSSRSYFSKIFKQKYNCKPSHYKQQVRELR